MREQLDTGTNLLALDLVGANFGNLFVRGFEGLLGAVLGALLLRDFLRAGGWLRCSRLRRPRLRFYTGADLQMYEARRAATKQA